MPVRAVPPNAVSLTGQLATAKSVGPAAFESSLERDWLAQLDRDPAVACFEVQPLVVPYHDAAGRPHTYTPDVLVTYADGRPLGLYEVKYRAALKPADPVERHLMARKFRAARAFARARGWRFQLVSEREIRGTVAGPAPESPPVAAPDLEAIAPAAWATALRRFEIIRPLLAPAGPGRAAVIARAQAMAVDPATVYRWLARYRLTGTVSALVPKARGHVPGTTLLPAAVEAVLGQVLRAEHLRAERPRVSDTVTAVRLACRRTGLRAPSEGTVRGRLRQLATAEREAVIAAREGRAAARRVRPAVGHFPHAPEAHAVLQMDHTQLDVIVVDEAHRQPIGRPWLTLAIDVASRMVSGLYVSLDPPGTLSAGLCLAHALLPKAPWLATLELPDTVPPALVVWPTHGLVRTVHLDNAKEFRGDTLRRACQEYGITLEWRPVRRPEYGGHIERLGGTLLGDLHRLPGTTKSSPAAKGQYDAEGHAVFTLQELERWLVLDVIGVYHRRRHRTLGTSPLAHYEAQLAVGGLAPLRTDPRLTDPRRVRLDFLPAIERTVRREGVVLDRVHYYADVLRPLVGSAADGQAQRVRFKRDPRDISVLYYHDGARYHAVPYRNLAHPPLSLWELRAALKRATDPDAGGRRDADEAMVFAAHEALRAIEAAAAGTTAKVRRAAERRRAHRGVHDGRPAAERAAPATAVDATDESYPPVEPYPTEIW